MSAPTVLVAGGEVGDAEALRAALIAEGVDVALAGADDEHRAEEVAREVHARNGRLDALVLNPGCSWGEEDGGWLDSMRALYTWTAAALPLIEGGCVLVSGPPVVTGPSPGYAAYVKARLSLRRFARHLALAEGDVDAVVVWSTAAGETAQTFTDRALILVTSGAARRSAAIRSPGAAVHV